MNDREWARTSTAPSTQSLIGKTFIGQIKQFTINRDENGVERLTLTNGIKVYDHSSHNLDEPFTTIMEGAVVGIQTPYGQFGGNGVPMQELFCWVTFTKSGPIVEAHGLSGAWFIPNQNSESPAWTRG